MGKKYTAMQADHQTFIQAQPVWFVATSAPGARINLSPKGGDTLRIIDANRVIWLNLVGSGNETAAHLLEDNRMTLMFCSFAEKPLILRLYGAATALHAGDAGWEEWAERFGEQPGARQLIDMRVELVHTSCGFGVPLMELVRPRETMDQWIERKGPQGLIDYQLRNNATSLDGRPTGLPLADGDDDS